MKYINMFLRISKPIYYTNKWKLLLIKKSIMKKLDVENENKDAEAVEVTTYTNS